MRRVLEVLAVVTIAGCGSNHPQLSLTKLPHVQHQAIVGGTVDPGDLGVVELFYTQLYSVSDCTGSACTQGCFLNTTGAACTSGADCVCGPGAVCSSELIGSKTLMTAGHCTDMVAGGELSGQDGPAIVLCTTADDINSVLSYQPTPDCNLVVFAIFNNTCTTNDEYSTCEYSLIVGADGGGAAAGGGNFVFVDQLVNPGYAGNVEPPNDDNDIGLAHLSDIILKNGNAFPPVMTFNRTSEGSSTACTDLGSLKFVGYGITSGNGTVSGVKMTVNHESGELDDFHNYEGNPNYIFSSSCSTLGSTEPTCSGDSGGPALNASGVIMSVTSLGDPTCVNYGQDTRVDAHAAWIDTTMTAAAWGDTANGQDAGSTSGSTGILGGTDDECADCSATGMCSGSGNSLAACAITQPDGGGDVCVLTCDSNENCPAGTGCIQLFGPGMGNFCFPNSGSCTGFVNPSSSTSTASNASSSSGGSGPGSTGSTGVAVTTGSVSGSTGGPASTSGGASATGNTSGSTGAHGSTAGAASTNGGAGTTGGAGTFGTTSSTGSSSAGTKGGCSSSGLGDLGPALFAMLALLRRRRAA